MRKLFNENIMNGFSIDGLEGIRPFPPAGTSHYRCTYTDVGDKTYRQVTAYDVDPNSLAQADKINAMNGGLGPQVWGDQKKLTWYEVSGPNPTVITTPTTTTNTTTTFSGQQAVDPVGAASSRTVAIPPGGTVTNATITVSNGGGEGNIITVTNMTTGAVLWTSGDVITGSTPLVANLTAGVNPGDQLQITQVHSPRSAPTSGDIWNYQLTVTTTQTVVGPTVTKTPTSPENQTVSSPGIPVTPKVIVNNTATTNNVTNNTPTTEGQ